MRTVIRLELIEDDLFWAHRRGAMDRDFQKWLRRWRRLGSDKSDTWIKRIHRDGRREFVQGVRDYSRANRSGSRGIFAFYALTPGVYEIAHRFKINRVRHYFIQVTDEKYHEITREEALCLTTNGI